MQRVRLATIVSIPMVAALVAAVLWRAEMRHEFIVAWMAPMLLTAAMAGVAAWQHREERHGRHRFDYLMSLPVGVSMLLLPILIRIDDVVDGGAEALLVALISTTSLLAISGLQFRRQRVRFLMVVGAVGGFYVGHLALLELFVLAALVIGWSLNLCLIVLYSLRVRDDMAEISTEYLRLSQLDGVTGALNREGLLAAWDQRVDDVAEFTLVVVDLDRFRHVNDRCGHEFGDAVLNETARRLFDSLGRDGVVARLAADTFAAIVDGSIDEPSVVKSIERAMSNIGGPFTLDGHEYNLNAVAGAVAVLVDDEFDTVLDRAAYAIEEAKRTEGLDLVFFDAEMRIGLDHQRRIDACLTESLESNRFEWWGQPILRADTLEPVAVELLCRLEFEDDILTPDRFLPQMAEANQLSELGRQTLAVAGRWLRHWRDDAELQDVSINVNLTPHHLVATAIEDLAATVDTHDLPRLGIELVETEVIPRGADLRERAETLESLGCRLVLDDFGAGYSALSLLGDLSVSEIKIDRSLVTELDTDERRTKLVAAVAQLGATLGTVIVCEGIETGPELERVRGLGVPLVQGWLFGKPMPLHHCEFELRRLSRKARRGRDDEERSPLGPPSFADSDAAPFAGRDEAGHA